MGDALSALDHAVSSHADSIADLRSDVAGLQHDRGHHGGGHGRNGTGPGLAMGENSHAQDSHDTAVGNGAVTHADSSVAVGDSATVEAVAAKSVAVGASSHVTAESGSAIGAGATASAENSVALGAGSVADEADTVSVGNADQQRRVTNVASGTADTDAVNVGQLNDVTREAVEQAKSYTDAGDAGTLDEAKAYTDAKVADFVHSSDFENYRSEVNQKFHGINVRMDRIGAMSAAMAGMAGAIAGAPSTSHRISAAVGGYKGEGAMAVGFSQRLPGSGSLLIGGSVAGGGEASATVGVSFGW